MIDKFYYKFPIGTICIEEEDGCIVGVHMAKEPKQQRQEEQIQETERLRETKLIKEAHRQLDEYFSGKRKTFDLPLKMKGTEFQMKAWEALRTIPYGETRCYGEMARLIGNPKASRAIGGANHNNPIMIIVPCHRVIGKNGALTGFGGGLEVKEYLLDLEKKYDFLLCPVRGN